MRFEDYEKQLPLLKDSLQDCSRVKYLHYDPLESTIHVLLDRKTLESNLSHLECKITYSQTYHEPQLLLRIWRFARFEGIDCLEPWFPQDLQHILPLPSWFQIGLDTISTASTSEPAAWYSIHACDTADIAGSRPSFESTYLSRWASVFIFDWIQT